MHARPHNLGVQHVQRDQVQQVDTLGDPYDVYIACAPSKILSKTYAELLSKGVQQLRESGELQTILRKYGLGDWQ